MYRIGEAACAAALLLAVGTLPVGQAPPAPTTSRSASWTAQFETPGEYDVRCTIHPGTRARLKVVD